MTEVSEKKDVQKLQRIVVDSLEDVKAQDFAVFNTEHLSALFERVIIASGTSNRQTKALAANVRDDVRDGGFGKPRIEGEENGEWIIVDCGSVVVHIMQPTIRQYYHLEEIWGDKPVRIKLGAPLPKAAPKVVEISEPVAKKSARSKSTAKPVAEKSKTSDKPKRSTTASSNKKPVAQKTTSNPKELSKPVAKKVINTKTPAKKTAAKKTTPLKSAVRQTRS